MKIRWPWTRRIEEFQCKLDELYRLHRELLSALEDQRIARPPENMDERSALKPINYKSIAESLYSFGLADATQVPPLMSCWFPPVVQDLPNAIRIAHEKVDKLALHLGVEFAREAARGPVLKVVKSPQKEPTPPPTVQPQ
jgi:hypothetical protein